MISTFDAKNMGIDIKKLKESVKPVRALSGNEIAARHLGECQLIFRLHTTWLIENLKDVLVLEDDEKTKNGEVSSSILGMDVLRNYKIDCRSRQFILER
jgi:hypothetical protein